jgi:hypothetical protein
VTTSVSLALDFLVRVQRPSGEFPTYAGPRGTEPQSWCYESSPFVTTFVASALAAIDDPRAESIQERAVEFLSREMEAPGIWRWYTADGPARVAPDLDDIVCASECLRNRHPHIFMGANHALILANRDPKGRFYTWIGRSAERNDVDSIVNINVLRYLGEREETRAAARWLVGLVLDGGALSPTYRYYTRDSAFFYALARCADHRWAAECASATLARVAALSADDALDAAYLGCAARRLGGSLPQDFLRSTQRDDGSWPRTAAYTVEQREDGRRWDWGSEALTTAIAIEALQ